MHTGSRNVDMLRVKKVAIVLQLLVMLRGYGMGELLCVCEPTEASFC